MWAPIMCQVLYEALERDYKYDVVPALQEPTF